MQVKDIMTTTPEFITPQTTAQEAAQKMTALDCGFLPVGENDRLTGVVTDRDITTGCTAAGFAPTTPVSKFMTEKVLYCCEGDDAEATAQNMQQNQVRRLIVLNNRQDKRLTGVVSVADIACCSSTSDTTCSNLIEGVSKSTSQTQAQAA